MRQKYVILTNFCVLGVPNALDVWKSNSNLYICRHYSYRLIEEPVLTTLYIVLIKQYPGYCLWFWSLNFRLNKHLIWVKKRAIRMFRNSGFSDFSLVFCFKVFFFFYIQGCLVVLWKKTRVWKTCIIYLCVCIALTHQCMSPVLLQICTEEVILPHEVWKLVGSLYLWRRQKKNYSSFLQPVWVKEIVLSRCIFV